MAEKAKGSKVSIDAERLGVAIENGLISPNEEDSEGEEANVVDGLFAVARAIEKLADAVLEGKSTTLPGTES